MPAIGAALAANLATFGITVTAGAAIAIHAAAFVVMTAWQKKQMSREQGRVVMPPRDVMLRSTIEHRRMIYGEAAASGTLVWANSAHNPGSGIYDLYLAVVHCGHEIDSYVGFYLDDKFIPAADIDVFPGDDGEVSGNSGGHDLHISVPPAPATGNPILWLRGHLGEDSQTADAFLTAAYSGIWTSDHRLRGNAYTVARLRQIENETESVWDGQPLVLQAKIRGKLVYDPRLDSTQTGGSGSHRVDDPTTWEWSANPVLCTRDYMVDAKLGMGRRVAHTAFDYAHIAEQADICDELVDIPGSATQARYSCNGVLSCGSTHEENLTELYATMNGRPAYKNGKHYIYAGAWETPIATLTEVHFAGDISYRKEPDSKDRYNQVRGVYYDPDRQDKRGEFLPVNDTAVRSSRDKGIVIPRDINLSLVNDEYQAQRLAFKLLYQDEDTGLCTIKCNMAALQFEVGDPIALTVARFGWVAKPFRIIGMTIPAYDQIELTLREYNESSFDDPDDTDYGGRTSAGILSMPRDLPAKVRTPHIAYNAATRSYSLEESGPENTSFDAGNMGVDTVVSVNVDVAETSDVVEITATYAVTIHSDDTLPAECFTYLLVDGTETSQGHYLFTLFDGTVLDNSRIEAQTMQVSGLTGTVPVALVMSPGSGEATVTYTNISMSVNVIRR